MNNLKKYAGLLNDEAPENHFLAYITPNERDMLVNAGGVKTPTPSGIFAYPPSDYYGGTHSDKPQRTRTNTPPSNDNNNNNNDDPIPSQPPINFNNNQQNPNIEFEGVSSELSPYETGMVDAEDEYLAPDKDHWKATQKAIKKFQKGDNYQADYSDWSKESREAYQLEMNKLKGTEGKNYSFYKGNEGTTNLSFSEQWKDVEATNPVLANIPIARLLIAAGRTLQENFTTDYGTARYGGVGTDGSSLRAIDGGGWFGMLFNSDGTVKENLTNDDYDRIYNAALPDLPYLVGGSQPQETSMVNEYFNNMNMNQGSPLSSNLQTDYNNAKNSINSILGVLPPSQQFGYSADPYGGLMASNLTTNPFNIDYLRRLGLI